MKMDSLPINWFDAVLVAVLVIGILRGRKRGMSLEIFTVTQWVCIVLAAAFLYDPLGRMLAGFTPFSLLFCYVACYVLLVAGISLGILSIKRALGGKIISSDTFGKGEYYLGMPAGMIRCLCILLCILAVLNARYYSPEEIRADEAYQKEVYGSEFFPGLNSIQRDVFQRSLIGPVIQKYCSFLLIRPTPPSKPELRHEREAWTP